MSAQRLRAIRVLLLAMVAAVGAAATQAPPARPAGNGSGGVNRPEHRDKPYVVIVSLDGFRHDYFDRFDLPSIRGVAERGARARSMQPVFPSMTFPNHYSLVTGLHPGRHGIVNNTFRDPVRGESYSMYDPRTVVDGSWYRGEPIWVTAEKQGMVAASYFWVASEAEIEGVRPTFWKTYAANVPNAERVAAVLEWLRLPEERRPHVLLLYFSDLDTASHRNPLTSPEIEKAARSLDEAIGTLVQGLRSSPVGDRVYLLLTSDHGMVETTREQVEVLESLLDPSDVEQAFGGPVANLHVRGGPARAAHVRSVLNARLAHGRAYLRQELPERYEYRDARVGDVVVVMDEGWMLTTASRERREFPRFGMHGWDPELPSMQALFVASGPRIRPGTVVERVHNVDVYPFVVEMLGLRPAPGIDGRAGAIARMIAQ